MTGKRVLLTIGLMLLASTGYADGDRDSGRSEAVIAGDYFGAGGTLEPGAPVEGDAFLTGGQLALRVPVSGDAVLSGGSINVADRVGEDLYAGGGNVTLDATVGHNARLAGGRVHVTRRGRIEGKATIAGGTIDVEGEIGRQLTAFGETVTIDGPIHGDVSVASRSLTLGPGTRIDGRLTYRGPAPAEIHPQAVVSRGVNYLLFRFDHNRLEPVARTAAWAGAAIFTGGLFIVGLLGILLMPQLTAGAAGVVRGRPFSSLGLGFALVICVPVAAIIAMATLIGIPLGFALLFAYPVLLMFGYLNGVLALSDGVANLVSRGKLAGRVLRIVLLAVALVVLLLVARLPVAGWIIGPLLMFAGTGALVLGMFSRR